MILIRRKQIPELFLRKAPIAITDTSNVTNVPSGMESTYRKFTSGCGTSNDFTTHEQYRHQQKQQQQQQQQQKKKKHTCDTHVLIASLSRSTNFTVRSTHFNVLVQRSCKYNRSHHVSTKLQQFLFTTRDLHNTLQRRKISFKALDFVLFQRILSILIVSLRKSRLVFCALVLLLPSIYSFTIPLHFLPIKQRSEERRVGKECRP